MSFEISHCLNRLAPICDLGGAGGLFRVPILDAISEQFKFVEPNLYYSSEIGARKNYCRV